MTESIDETRFDEELNDESLDRGDPVRFTGCRRSDARACYFCGR